MEIWLSLALMTVSALQEILLEIILLRKEDKKNQQAIISNLISRYSRLYDILKVLSYITAILSKLGGLIMLERLLFLHFMTTVHNKIS